MAASVAKSIDLSMTSPRPFLLFLLFPFLLVCITRERNHRSLTELATVGGVNRRVISSLSENCSAGIDMLKLSLFGSPPSFIAHLSEIIISEMSAQLRDIEAEISLIKNPISAFKYLSEEASLSFYIQPPPSPLLSGQQIASPPALLSVSFNSKNGNRTRSL